MALPVGAAQPNGTRTMVQRSKRSLAHTSGDPIVSGTLRDRLFAFDRPKLLRKLDDNAPNGGAVEGRAGVLHIDVALLTPPGAAKWSRTFQQQRGDIAIGLKRR